MPTCVAICSPLASMRSSRETTFRPGSRPTSKVSMPSSWRGTWVTPGCSTRYFQARRRLCTWERGRSRSKVHRGSRSLAPSERHRHPGGARRYPTAPRPAHRRGVVIVGVRRQPEFFPSTRAWYRCRSHRTGRPSWPPSPTPSPTPSATTSARWPFGFFNVFGPLQAAGHSYAAVVPSFCVSCSQQRPSHDPWGR